MTPEQKAMNDNELMYHGHEVVEKNRDDLSDADVKESSVDDASVPPSRHVVHATERRVIERMARRETNTLRGWRTILLLFMLSMGAMVAAGVYEYVRQQKLDESLQNYALFTETIQEASRDHSRDMAMAMASLAQSMSVAGQSTASSDTTFPFVTLDTFDVPAHHAVQLAHGVEYVTWNPLVRREERAAWSSYVNEHFVPWYAVSQGLHPHDEFEGNATVLLRDYIWDGDRHGNGTNVAAVASSRELLAPIWQCSPPPQSPQFLNYDVLSDPHVARLAPTLWRSNERPSTRALLTAVDDAYAVWPRALHDPTAIHAPSDEVNAGTQPLAMMVQPVYDNPLWHQDVALTSETLSGTVVGLLVSNLAFDSFVAHVLPQGVVGIVAVLRNSCHQSFSYIFRGERAEYLGVGDFHDEQYSDTEFIVPLFQWGNDTIDAPETNDSCAYALYLYFSNEFITHEDNQFELTAFLAIAVIFALMATVFFLYDYMVHRRNTKIICAAASSNAFLSTLFPSQVRDRLMQDDPVNDGKKNRHDRSNAPKLQRLMESGRFPGDDDEDAQLAFDSKPIADLFSETTILFADIVGFSAWSSVREPSQVFLFLETLFRAFDEIAKKRRVFKVETVGDCYVAVVGLPDIRKDHAVVLARFARECMLRMRVLCQKLEATFGPDTGDLAMRMGIHSGPVTAGVLRGERSRFQLFGDTMNTAARMEQNGWADKIHVSQETADLLIAAGKAKWLTRREEAVYSKDKGGVQTYWLEASAPRTRSETSSQRESITTDELSKVASSDTDGLASSSNMARPLGDSKMRRLVKWNEDVLVRLLKQIVARRIACPVPASEKIKPNEGRYVLGRDSTLTDDVKEIIPFPRFRATKSKIDNDVTLDPAVVSQVHQFVTCLAELHCSTNEFHNFEQASHVAMSVVKLLSRMDVDPSEASVEENPQQQLHDRTYGISSDPLTQFGCVLAALIHQVAHPGVSNEQLVQEQNDLSTRYKKYGSPTERNAIQAAWNLLFQKEYTMLRHVIYETDSELVRFRQVVVNAVVATDVWDTTGRDRRTRQWERAFSPTALTLTNSEMMNRRATIVIDCLVQASCLAHTMQHWYVYRKWNERYYMECNEAYTQGRCALHVNPADDWYEDELRTFDFLVVPLARKLQACKVFGVASDEYVNYAGRNRHEWEKRGRDLVLELVDRVRVRSVQELQSSSTFL